MSMTLPPVAMRGGASAGRRVTPWIWLLGALVSPLAVACDDDAAPPTVALRGFVGDFVPAGGLVPLEGVSVCVFDRDDIPCVTTAADGSYALDALPANRDLLIAYTRSEFVAQMGMLSTGTDDVGPIEIRMARESSAQLFFTAIGATYPLGDTGGITFGAYPTSTGGGVDADAGLAGYAAHLTPESGTGPVYINDSELPDPSLVTTQKPGWGLYANVTSGTVSVRFEKAGRPCTRVRPGYGWTRSLSDGVLEMPVIAGFLTAGAVLCDE